MQDLLGVDLLLHNFDPKEAGKRMGVVEEEEEQDDF